MNRMLTLCAGLALAALGQANADTLLKLDARADTAAPQTGHIQLGTARAPKGETLAINNQYLLRDGKPWLPVMGEYHYTRAPAAQWDAQLRLMKAAGIDIVASYVFWNHHQEQPGAFDWKGNRDLRRFVQLAQAAGLQVVVRLGPWVHGEARYGGIPDWVVDAMPTRGNDAEYLGHVERLYAEIGTQIKGLLWKDGGPVVGVQLENEYNLRGPGGGEEHISALKKLALKAGMDVPLYTVTGWDGAVYPSGEVIPVFGGYPDEPWARSEKELPPKETHAFRFNTRVSGDLGAQTRSHGAGTAETDKDKVPFFGAEYGPGLPAMYRRRTLVSPDDIAAMLPVQIGSGVNLLGYYMFHGGRNPVGVGGTGLEESSLSGGYNDTPRISYDFQAPLGPDGQQRAVLTKLRPFHYFLRDHGALLARMTVRQPERVPANPTDLQTLRWSVRSRGDSGFLFVNNHVRQYAMPAHTAVRFEVQLPGGALTLPSRPIDIPNGAYFIWPINMDLDGVLLRHATAQPVARLDAGVQGIVHVFAAVAGIDVEFALPEGVRTWAPDAGTLQRVGSAGGRAVSVMLLTPAQRDQLQILDLAGQRRLVFSDQQAWVADGKLQLRGTGTQPLRAAVFPALPKPRAAGLQVSQDGLLQRLELAADSAAEPALHVSALRPAGNAPRVLKGGLAGAALQPIPEAFATAATWSLKLPTQLTPDAEDVLLELDFVGDIGRVFHGTRMLDDWFYNGQRWQIGLRQFGLKPGAELRLGVLPLRADAPIYIDAAHRPAFAAGQAQIAELRGARLLPVRRVSITP
ncbi:MULTISPECIES: beta-galactosidase [unclassified Roseateles]|uniref:beta-galactosidase n=1 Tax=unclassified Roseateles TaxID=2626991 RepID=UPI0006F483BD|nr:MULTISPECIES: beta-galactosidase [unclassified Roseateles]KQW43623.1 glycoside hydrolase family 35 [Pelomonas sp. Root405]KRA71361.1 glycoside hydrolase family 35 [Pelomonas sp. Root662]